MFDCPLEHGKCTELRLKVQGCPSSSQMLVLSRLSSVYPTSSSWVQHKYLYQPYYRSAEGQY